MTDFKERLFEELHDAYLSHEHAHRYWWAARFARGKSVVDIACGSGYGSRILANHAGSVIGIDLDQDAVNGAATRYKAPNLSFRQGDCRDFKLEEPVDLIVSFETLEHIEEHEMFLDSIRRSLRSGGVCIISTPNKAEYSDKAGSLNPFHKRELTIDQFRELTGRYFKHTALLGQRITANSWIMPIEHEALRMAPTSSEMVVNHQRGITELADKNELAPIFVVAVCSEQPLDLDLLSENSILFDSKNALAVVNAGDLAPIQGSEAHLRNLDRTFEAQVNRFNSVIERLTSIESRLDAQQPEAAALTDECREIAKLIREMKGGQNYLLEAFQRMQIRLDEDRRRLEAAESWIADFSFSKRIGNKVKRSLKSLLPSASS